MTVPAFSPSQINEMRTAYANRDRRACNAKAWSHADSADGMLSMKVDSEEGGWLTSAVSYIVAERDGQPYFRHNADSDVRYEWPVIRQDGRVGWVVREDGKERVLAQVPLWNNLMTFPRKLFTLEANMRPVGIGADGHTMILTDGKRVMAYDTEPDRGARLARIGDARRGLTQLASLRDEVKGVCPLSDGSLLTFPSRLSRHGSKLIPPNGSGPVVDVPLRLLSEQDFQTRVRGQMSWADSGEVDRLLRQSPPFVDDAGNVAEMGVASSSATRVFVVPNRESNTTDVFTFDQRDLKKCTSYAGTALRRRDDVFSTSVTLSRQETLIGVLENATNPASAGAVQTRLIDVATGRSAVLPGTNMSKSAMRHTADESRVVAHGEGDALWLFDRAQASVSRLGNLAIAKPLQARDVNLAWTNDEQHVIAAFPHVNGSGWALQVFGLDGFQAWIPRIEGYRFDNGVLIFTADGKEHTLPADLTTIDREAWFKNYLDSLSLASLGDDWLVGAARGTGAAPADASPVTVERADDHITIGGLRVPVRKAADAEAGAPTS